MGGMNDYVKEYSELSVYEQKLLETITTIYDQSKGQTKKFSQIVNMAIQKYAWEKKRC